MDLWVVIGGTAAVLTMFSFLPQIIKIIRNKSVNDLSLITLFQFSLGVSLWALYGFHIKDMIIIVANLVTLSELIIILFFYFKFRRLQL